MILYGLVLLALFAAVSRLAKTPEVQTLPYSSVVKLFEDEQVKSFVIKDNVITMQLHSPYEGQDTARAELVDFTVFYSDLNDTVRDQYQRGIIESYNYPPYSEPSIFVQMLPYLIIGILFLAAWFILMNRANGGQNALKFSRSGARLATDSDKVTFADVAGAEEEKEELAEVVDFLREPQKYIKMGAKIPKGILLVGPPGTGKTLIAKAVAGEANVQFLSISGSEFVELYVGVGASRVRDLFEQAKKLAPAIIFIDEIDAEGRRRGAGLGGGHDEREQTLNQLLVEMDGFGKNNGVIVMAATNRKDILDPALLRPGRFDRQIYIGVPDSRGREAILKVHAKDKPLAEDVDLKTIARATTGFTGADISNLLNEAALLAARNDRRFITMPDMEEAMMKVVAGPEKRSRVITPHERRLTAVPEAGHAVAMYYLPTADPVHQITIVPRGPAGGMTMSLPQEDRWHATRQEMFEDIVSFLGGRIAEQLRMNDISTGASNDIERATAIARDMVSRYGMSERIGTVSYAGDQEIFVGRDYEKTKSYSERTAGDIDAEVKAILDEAYAKCTEILTEHGDKLDQVSAFLLEHEKMSRTQFLACMEGREIPGVTEDSLFDGFEETEQ
ncbi:MAG: ATP-dependent zinc metalloprotease FtsH [Oscillospiraceae bacterium]|nr:ATP-dependent zinc metalloprotease FtsH [Oscillospiraceae bacterium]